MLNFIQMAVDLFPNLSYFPGNWFFLFFLYRINFPRDDFGLWKGSIRCLMNSFECRRNFRKFWHLWLTCWYEWRLHSLCVPLDMLAEYTIMELTKQLVFVVVYRAVPSTWERGMSRAKRFDIANPTKYWGDLMCPVWIIMRIPLKMGLLSCW